MQHVSPTVGFWTRWCSMRTLVSFWIFQGCPNPAVPKRATIMQSVCAGQMGAFSCCRPTVVVIIGPLPTRLILAFKWCGVCFYNLNK